MSTSSVGQPYNSGQPAAPAGPASPAGTAPAFSYSDFVAAMSTQQTDPTASDFNADPGSQFGQDLVSTSPFFQAKHKLTNKVSLAKKAEFDKAMADFKSMKSVAHAANQNSLAPAKSGSGGRWTTSGAKSKNGDETFKPRRHRDPQQELDATFTTIDPNATTEANTSNEDTHDAHDDNDCHSSDCGCGCHGGGGDNSSGGDSSAGSCGGSAAATSAGH